MIGHEFLAVVDCTVHCLCWFIDFFLKNMIKTLPRLSINHNLFLKFFHWKSTIVFKIYQMIVRNLASLEFHGHIIKSHFLRSYYHSIIVLANNKFTRILDKVNVIRFLCTHDSQFPGAHEFLLNYVLNRIPEGCTGVHLHPDQLRNQLRICLRLLLHYRTRIRTLLELDLQVLVVCDKTIMEDYQSIFFIKMRMSQWIFNLSLKRSISRVNNAHSASDFLVLEHEWVHHLVETIVLQGHRHPLSQHVLILLYIL